MKTGLIQLLWCSKLFSLLTNCSCQTMFLLLVSSFATILSGVSADCGLVRCYVARDPVIKDATFVNCSAFEDARVSEANKTNNLDIDCLPEMGKISIMTIYKFYPIRIVPGALARLFASAKKEAFEEQYIYNDTIIEPFRTLSFSRIYFDRLTEESFRGMEAEGLELIQLDSPREPFSSELFTRVSSAQTFTLQLYCQPDMMVQPFFKLKLVSKKWTIDLFKCQGLAVRCKRDSCLQPLNTTIELISVPQNRNSYTFTTDMCRDVGARNCPQKRASSSRSTSDLNAASQNNQREQGQFEAKPLSRPSTKPCNFSSPTVCSSCMCQWIQLTIAIICLHFWWNIQ